MNRHSADPAVRLSCRGRIAALFGVGLLALLGTHAARADSATLRGATTGASSSAASSGTGSSDTASTSQSCPTAVQISSVSIALQGDTVVVSIQHTGQGCPNATPATLHAHQNLLASPHAGSNPDHQWNKDYSVGPDFGNTVQFGLLAAADGDCFVQVDVHAGSIRRGSFFPTGPCESSTASESSSAPASSTAAESSSAPASSTAAESSSAPESSTAPESSSGAPSSSSAAESSIAGSSAVQSSATVPAFSSSVAAFVIGNTSTPSQSGLLASTGVRTGVPLALALLLIGFGTVLSRTARRRRH
jgi:hypothetical protein